MPLNPFDLRGPEFLVFYIVVGMLTLLFTRIRMKQQEAQWPVPRLDMTDPYEIAYLRGGENEALRIAALSLIDRGLLGADDDSLRTKYSDADQRVRRPIEKAILRKFKTAQSAKEMFSDDTLKSACYEYRNSLGQHRLIASESVFAARRPIFQLGLLVLLGLAGIKLAVAISRGRHNILFLIGLAVIFTVYLFKNYKKERTALGDRVLTDLKTLFAGLKERGYLIKPGGETNEAALLAAVFGVSALSAASFPYIQKLFPKASNSNYSCSTTSCGSSCGSSCGGGGCGGGCGGCGS